jgi:hypothetical protein
MRRPEGRLIINPRRREALTLVLSLAPDAIHKMSPKQRIFRRKHSGDRI